MTMVIAKVIFRQEIICVDRFIFIGLDCRSYVEKYGKGRRRSGIPRMTRDATKIICYLKLPHTIYSSFHRWEYVLWQTLSNLLHAKRLNCTMCAISRLLKHKCSNVEYQNNPESSQSHVKTSSIITETDPQRICGIYEHNQCFGHSNRPTSLSPMIIEYS